MIARRAIYGIAGQAGMSKTGQSVCGPLALVACLYVRQLLIRGPEFPLSCLVTWPGCLIGERGFGQEQSANAARHGRRTRRRRRCSGGGCCWGDGVVASREADGDVEAPGGQGGGVHGSVVDGGDG
jgi:hypothetical protein